MTDYNTEIITTNCCNKEMIKLNMDYNFLDNGKNTIFYYFCGECGKVLYLTEEEIDEEVISSMLELHEEELKYTAIYKKLKN